MKTFIISLKRSFLTETLKYKRTYALLLTVLAPAFLASIYFLIYYFKAESIISEGANGWNHLINNSLQIGAVLLFPLFIILLIMFIHTVDHRTNGQRLAILFPIDRKAGFIAKIIVSLSMIIFTLFLFLIFIHVAAYINSMKYPDLFHFDTVVIYNTVKKAGLILICILFMFAMQFWFSLRWNNVLIPLGIGFAGFISALILIQGWEHIDYHPYALHMLVTGDDIKAEITRQLSIYSLIGFILTLSLAYFEFRYKKIIH
jgi:hypothetical protein